MLPRSLVTVHCSGEYGEIHPPSNNTIVVYDLLPSALARGIVSRIVARIGSKCCMYVCMYVFPVTLLECN